MSMTEASENGTAMVIVAGLAGSGKTETGKLLASVTGWALLDKDSLTRSLTERLLLRLNGDPHDRHTPLYVDVVRPLEYDCLLKTAWENVVCGVSVILSAPFIREVNDDGWLRGVRQRCRRSGSRLHVVWVASDPPSMRIRLTSRGADRDVWKLANWDAYLQTVDAEMLPGCDHIVIDNCIEAELPLVDQVQVIAHRLRSGSELCVD
ncbi:MAG TPA: AAA family ATPase [Acidimicrobiales bacterium]|nr:AAA family ATPase [Acidimicrobiales bacterium]